MTYTTENGIRWTEKPRGLTPGTGQLVNAPPPRTLEDAKRDLGELMTGEKGADRG